MLGDDTIMDVARFPNFDVVNLNLNTSTIGDLFGTISIQGLGQDVGGSNVTLETNATIIASSQASFVRGRARHRRPARRWRSHPTTLRSRSRFQCTTSTIPPFRPRVRSPRSRVFSGALTLETLPSGQIGGQSSNLVLRLDPGALSLTTTDYSLQIAIDDQPLPGARSSTLSLTISVSLESEGIPGDLNNDGIVNGIDLASLLASWGTAENDLDGDGSRGWCRSCCVACLLGNRLTGSHPGSGGRKGRGGIRTHE